MIVTHFILYATALAEAQATTECDAARTLTVVDVSSGARKRLELRLNNDSSSAASPMGLCHYQLATGALSSLSINRDNHAQGFYQATGERDMFDVFHRDGVTYQKPAILKNGTRCGIETFIDDDIQPQMIRRRRRRSKDVGTTETLELIVVLSSGMLAQYEAKEAGINKHERVRPLLERYESVYKTLQTLYKLVDLRIIMLDIMIWETDPIKLGGESSDAILESFKKWVQEQKRSTDNTIATRRWRSQDAAHLVMPENTWSDTSTLGKAWTSALCGTFSNGVNEDHRDSHLGVATTMAHELGHNLGLNHDSADCGCHDCIMASTAGFTPPDDWSQCSRDTLEAKLPTWPCLADTPQPELIYGEPVCGNGLLEKGEDCDCGTQDQAQCNSDCCNAAKCKFNEGANCDSSDGPCCHNCRLQPPGTTCRDSTSECDLPEYCSGYHARCPSNVFKRNGEECTDSGRCMAGSCQRRDTHCAYMYGEGATVSDSCMAEYNKVSRTFVTASGNCGEQWFSSSSKAYYFGCKWAQDSLCGKAQCVGGDYNEVEQTEFKSIPVRRHGQCHYLDWTGHHDEESSDSNYNFDQMPTGTPCGDESVCFVESNRQQCRHLAELWTRDEWGECASNCTGRGVCNSRGNCHCDPGYGGEACERKGYGGSVDSGYPQDYQMDDGTLMFICIFSLLGLALVIAALVAKFYCGRNLTDICLYQPCAGDYRQNKQPKYVTTAESQQQQQQQNNDPFRPIWGDISAPQGPPPKIEMPVRPIKPPKPIITAKKPALPPKPIFGDPFAVDWGSGDNADNEERARLSDDNTLHHQPHRSAPAPPRAPTPPPKDY